MKTQNKTKGFTLIEMILVLAIMSSILLLIMNYTSQRLDQYRRDRAALQMQQVLNAGLAYYVQNGVWPVQCGATNAVPLDTQVSGSYSLLQQSNYLPNVPIYSPWPSLGSYYISCNGGTAAPGNNAIGNFYVSVITPTAADAQILAGELPLAQIDTTTNTVSAQVLVPGQNLNNARSVNYSGVYYSGACVPVPTCPTSMTAEIVAVPEGVAGVYDPPEALTAGVPTGQPCSTSSIVNTTTGQVTNTGDCQYIAAVPITSYQAFATGGPGITSPASCSTASSTSPTSETCYADQNFSGGTTSAATMSYWRVCLQVGSSKGEVDTQINTTYSLNGTNNPGLFWTQAMGKIVAFTRCVPSGGEPTGSSLNVWGT